MNIANNPKKLKIAIVYDMLYPFNVGGAEVRNYEIAKILAKKHEVHLIGVKLWNGKDVIKKNGITYHGICRYKQMYDFSGKRSITEPIYYSIRLFFYLLKHDFDIIDVSSFPYFPALSCKLYSKIKKIPLIITWHEVWMEYWYEYIGNIKGFFGKIIENITSRLTDNVVSVSDHTKKRLEQLNVPEENIKIIYNGVDIKKIDKIKPAEESDIIYTGRLLKHKNIDLLIKAIALVKKTKPEIKAVITGNGPEKENLEKLTKSLGLEKNIKFTGFLPNINDVYAYIKASKVFVLPSELEGFGMVVIEANACKLPVVVVKHKRNAAVELVKDNGIIIEKSEKEIAKAISDLLKNEELRKKLGLNGYEKAKKFDWNIQCKDLIDYYNRVLER